MSHLDRVLTKLLDPTGKWQMNRGRRYRTRRLSSGLGLRYTPAASDIDMHCLSLSRTVVPPSETEVATVVASLGRVLGHPGFAPMLTEPSATVRRLHWRIGAPKDKPQESPHE